MGFVCSNVGNQIYFEMVYTHIYFSSDLIATYESWCRALKWTHFNWCFWLIRNQVVNLYQFLDRCPAVFLKNQSRQSSLIFTDRMVSACPPLLNELFWRLLHLNCPKVSFLIIWAVFTTHGAIWFSSWYQGSHGIHTICNTLNISLYRKYVSPQGAGRNPPSSSLDREYSPYWGL